MNTKFTSCQCHCEAEGRGNLLVIAFPPAGGEAMTIVLPQVNFVTDYVRNSDDFFDKI